jgi:hypothetical protein
MNLFLEVLEERCNPSPVALPGSPYVLPGANTAWDLGHGPFMASPVTADLDGDGLQEVITPGGNGQLYAYRYNAANGQMFVDHIYRTGQNAPLQATPVVVNLPSGPAIFDGAANGFVFGWNARTGNFLPGWPLLLPAGNTGDPLNIYGSLAAGDLERNGVPDIIVPSLNHEVSAYRPDGTLFWRLNNDDTEFTGAAIGDLNNDGNLEVIVGGDSSPSQFGWQGGKVQALSADGHREWMKQTDQVIWSSPALADLNNNGKLDVIVGTGYFYPRNPDGSPGGPPFVGNTVYALDSQGNDLPGWPYSTAPSNIDARTYSSPAIADLTGNGSLDVIIADGHGQVHAIQPNGQPLWVSQAFAVQNLWTSPIVADVMGNGTPDVVIAGGGQIVALDGSTGTQVWMTQDGFPHYSAAVVGHFKGDGSYQMAVVGNGLSGSQVLSPSFLSVFDLGNTSLTPPWGQYRQGLGNDAVIRSISYSTSLLDSLYTNALGRPITDFELNNIWLPEMTHAPSLRPFIEQIIGSPEARSVQINSWYRNYLGRTGEAAGVQAWQNYLATGQSYASAQAQFAGSPEAFSIAGSTNPGWVTYLYQRILHRNPAQFEVNLWVNQLNSGQITRPGIAFKFFLSVEMTNDLTIQWYRQYQPSGLSVAPVDNLQAMAFDMRRGRTEEQVLIDMLMAQGDYVSTQLEGSWLRVAYADILQRSISPPETSFWLGQIEAGTSLGAIASALTHSSEYYNVLVRGWFVRYLGRNPNPGEATPWVNGLLGGVSQVGSINALVQSNEYYVHAGNNNAAFVNKIYSDLLGRAPNANELSTWANNPNVRTALPQLILFQAPNEFFQNLTNQYYLLLLRRLASTPSDLSRLIPVGTPFGGQVWVNAMLAGTNPADVLAAILTSGEYLNVARYKSFWLGARWLS